MADLSFNTSHTTKQRTEPGRRTRLLVAGMMVVSFILGFSLVMLLTDHPTPTVVTAQPSIPQTSTPQTPHPSLDETTAETATEADTADALQEEALRPPEVPPGRTPDGIEIEGVLYLKCFGKDGTVYKNESCASLPIFEKRFSTRLYVVDRCAKEVAGTPLDGILSLGANIDLEKKEVGFWSGPSSELNDSPKIGSCVRRELSGLPIYDLKGKHASYRLFFTIRFEDPQKRAKRIKKLRRRGRQVQVVKDHVRVRREPKDGYPFGKLGSDEKAVFIKRKDDWCRIITPNDNDGWIICDALDL